MTVCLGAKGVGCLYSYPTLKCKNSNLWILGELHYATTLTNNNEYVELHEVFLFQ